MVSKQLGTILNKLGKVKPISTGGYSACCPAHEDKHNSLGITEEGDRILITCRTGCTTDQIMSALGMDMKDLFRHSEVKETSWNIKNRAGEIIATHIRYDKEGKKSFAWYRGAEKGLGDIKTADLPLYGIDKLTDTKMIIICEGEKSADALMSKNIQAVGTVSGASGCPSEEVLSELIDIDDIYLWPDNDDPGIKHMDKIASKLIGLGKTPYIISWAEAPKRGDAADYNGDIKELLATATLWQNQPEKHGPEVEQGFGFINYRWADYGLRILVDRYSDKGTAELSFHIMNGHGDEKLLHYTSANLLASTTMSGLAKRMDKNNSDIPWDDILTFITWKTMQIAREGESSTDIIPDEHDTLEVDYLLTPLLYLNHPSVFFGDYGSLKSFISLVIAYIVQLPEIDDHLGIIRTDITPAKVLYLDYEDDATSFRRRWSAINNGFGKSKINLIHQRMTSQLCDNVEKIKRIVDDRSINLLIVDSLGPAARGNLNDPEPAIKYHAALRQIGVTSLTLAHTAKDNNAGKRTIFGSVFFTNLARSVWECKCEQEVNEDEVTVIMKHNKANLSRLHNPLGFKFNFTDRAITVSRADLTETAELSKELPAPIRIKVALRHGPKAINDIAEEIGKDLQYTRVALYRMQSKGQVRKDGISWSLATNG